MCYKGLLSFRLDSEKRCVFILSSSSQPKINKFSTSSLLHCLGMAGAGLAMLYTIFFVKDSRTMRPKEVLDIIEKEKQLRTTLSGGGGQKAREVSTKRS